MNNQKGPNISNGNNGGDKTPSLSAIKSENELKKQAELNDSKKSNDYSNNSLRKNSSNNYNNYKNNNKNRDSKDAANIKNKAQNKKNKDGLNGLKKKVAKEAIKKYAASKGIPEETADKILNSKLGQQAIDKALNGENSLNPVKSFNKFLDKRANAGLSGEEKDKLQSASNSANGSFSLTMNSNTIKLFVLVGCVFAIIIMFVMTIIVDIAENGTNSAVFAEISGELTVEEQEQLLQEVGMGNDNTGTAIGNKRKYPDLYYKRIKNLGNIFTAQKACKGQECANRAEVLYYSKINDISNRYKQKYGVTLDWALISIVNTYGQDMEIVMQNNIGGYNKNVVSNVDATTTLDWDIDYKNDFADKYLNPNNSDYDLQILAKNMVTKRTIQTCDSVTQEDIDVEDKYFNVGGSKRMPCSGQYSIYSTYTLDMDKFDNFMLEYIDKKVMNAKTTTINKGDNGYTGVIDPNAKSLADAMISLAKSQLGNNGDPYRSGSYAWCAMFTRWITLNTVYNGQRITDKVNINAISDISSVYAWLNYFKNNNSLGFYYSNRDSFMKLPNYKRYIPKTGDFIFFDWNMAWNGQGDMPYLQRSHIAIIEYVEGDTIHIIGGNQSNKVSELTYSINDQRIAGYGVWY